MAVLLTYLKTFKGDLTVKEKRYEKENLLSLLVSIIISGILLFGAIFLFESRVFLIFQNNLTMLSILCTLAFIVLFVSSLVFSVTISVFIIEIIKKLKKKI